jgi:hypothetical protein
LEDEDDEGEAHLENIHDDRGEKIFPPSHAASRIYAKQPVDPVLDGAKDPIYSAWCACENASDIGREQSAED